jgi:predicted transcriptional regulator
VSQRLSTLQREAEPLTSAQREWVAQKQRLIVNVAGVVNREAGEETSAQVLQGICETLGLLMTRTAEVLKACKAGAQAATDDV